MQFIFTERSVTITDSAGVEPLRGCVRVSGVAASARCDLRAIGARAVVSLGDRNDLVRLQSRDDRGHLGRSRVAGEFHAGSGDDIVIGGDGFEQQLSGGPGDDLLVGGRRSDDFRGGPGRDRMLGGPTADYFFEGKRANGSDTIVAGRPKIMSDQFATCCEAGDEVRYSERRRDVVADLDDRRDDGERGERDRLLGVENIHSGGGSDRLSGDRGNNVLDGGGGSDSLRGGRGGDSLSGDAGPDELTGGPGTDYMDADIGDDRVLADDGSHDFIACGFGLDSARLDGFDFFENAESFGGEPDYVCEQVSRRGAAGLINLSHIELTHQRSGAVETFYVVGCPGDALHCDGTLTLLRADQILFTDPISLDSGKRETFFGSIPKELASSVPRKGFRGTVLISFSDPSGATVERRSAVNVRVR